MVPGVAAHVVQRGVNRQCCFAAEADRLVYLSVLREALGWTSCALHAYCLMTNHVHLLLTPPDEHACSKLMYEIGRRYVPYFNRRHERTGTLWEGRFRPCLVDSREYVLSCYRYIELNPLRAAMVSSPSAYAWSSHLGNTGRRVDDLLVAHVEYLALGEDKGSRVLAYQRFCEAGESADFISAVREATTSGVPLASEAFKKELQKGGLRVERGKPGPHTDTPIERAPVSGELAF